ncbi:TPR repeat protein [Prosthecobacter fusiformis]|uniref:TPR repeat protein n=1 Tax=Prosthecobacter fusiformis TaxID=48464 RepID=A0A4V3FDX8_9BACT|nr:SEL1-like repeat protein [Prosthecobacter fusiformis]TDU62484.1 TPR repeat protein [Prosthecobacter fusiformis]
MPSPRRYIITQDGEKLGEFTEEQALHYLDEGSLHPHDLGWAPGMDAPQPLSALFHQAGTSTPPPIPHRTIIHPSPQPQSPPPSSYLPSPTLHSAPTPLTTGYIPAVQGSHFIPVHHRRPRSILRSILATLIVLLLLITASIIWYHLSHGPQALYQRALTQAQKHPTRFLTAGATLLQQAASQAHAPAQVELALCHLRADGVPRDVPTALQLLQAAADAGDPRAQALYASMLSLGQGIPRDLAKAQSYLRLALDQSHPEAFYQWAQWLSHQAKTTGIPNPQEIYLSTTLAAEKGHLSALATLGWMQIHGLGTTANSHHGLTLLSKAAAQHDPAAHHYLGLLALAGDNTLVSPTLAEHHLLIAAEAAHPQAILALAKYYQQHHQSAAAETWLTIGTDLQLPDLLFLRSQHTLHTSLEESLQWLQKAADLGHPQAQHQLAAHYQKGHGLPQSDTLAKKWENLATSQGYRSQE